MLRRALLVIGTLALLGACVALLERAFGAACYLFVTGALVTGGIVFERSHYARPADRGRGRWQATGERFVDPTSGKLVEVYFNAETGERDYRPSDAPPGNA